MISFFYFAIAAVLVGGTDLQSGQFVPLAADAGFLACPQSLKALDGIGHCVDVEPLAAVRSEENPVGSDIFVQRTEFSRTG